MFAPPGISLSNPERVKTGVLTRLRHFDGFVCRLHAELQHADVERSGHDLVLSPALEESEK